MSTAAAAAADATASAPAKKGKKKLIIIVAVAVLVLALGGVAALLLLKKKPHDGDADAEAGERGATVSESVVKPADRPAPVFVPLEPFTVNLADRDAERYAQIGITLEVADAHTGEQIKAYMPAIRNHFLLAIADNTATELLAREGKVRLSERLRREAARALGYTVPEMESKEPAPAAAEGEKPKQSKKKGAKEKIELPVRAVQFSNFIIQ